MIISKKIDGFMNESSWIRKMFEEGIELKSKLGSENVFDFSLGNPVISPPKKFLNALSGISAESSPGIHSYMQNAGFTKTRMTLANKISMESNSKLNSGDILMTSGAAGAINVILHSILNPDEEVIILKPFFPEYKFYIDNHNGKAIYCDFEDDFLPSLKHLKKLISKKTKAIIYNSPNNPTGVTYPEKFLRNMVDIITEKEKIYDSNIFIISDEPYRYLEYEEINQPFIFDLHPTGIVASSFSKDLSLAGERIGFIAISPAMPSKEKIISALTFSNRTLGFVNAPALAQRLVGASMSSLVDKKKYLLKRDLLYNALNEFGYDIVKPTGAFYLFPKCPIPDDINFVNSLKEENILVVPGSGFGAPGYFRISYSVEDEVITNSLEGFKRAINKFKV
tara:strand:+ start:60 stop:1244 length:1185 start_codon:yes stop_codon:yes gene_type:complete